MLDTRLIDYDIFDGLYNKTDYELDRLRKKEDTRKVAVFCNDNMKMLNSYFDVKEDLDCYIEKFEEEMDREMDDKRKELLFKEFFYVQFNLYSMFENVTEKIISKYKNDMFKYRDCLLLIEEKYADIFDKVQGLKVSTKILKI